MFLGTVWGADHGTGLSSLPCSRFQKEARACLKIDFMLYAPRNRRKKLRGFFSSTTGGSDVLDDAPIFGARRRRPFLRVLKTYATSRIRSSYSGAFRLLRKRKSVLQDVVEACQFGPTGYAGGHFAEGRGLPFAAKFAASSIPPIIFFFACSSVWISLKT
jgi:hypothetical protein